MKRKVLAVLAITLAMVLAGCGGPSAGPGGDADASTPQEGGDLVMARSADPSSLIPWVPTDNLAIWTMEEIYDTLLVPTADGKDVEPGLATEWEQSKDKLSWTFTLREDVTFHNGDPLTSADVKWSLEQASKPEAPFSSINQVISKIETPDDHTVVITTKNPWSPLPADMALFANSIVPKDYAGMTEEEFAEAPIGTGPFMFESWTKGQQLKLVKNPDHWREEGPYLDSVTFTVVADSNTRATQVQSGQAHINEFPAYSSIQGLEEGQGSVQVGRFQSSRVDYLTMNNEKEPFNDPMVRKAIAHAVNRQALIDAVLFGNGEPATSYLTPALWAHDDSIVPPEYDLEAAEQALAESSVPDGFSTTLLYSSGDADASAAGQLIQSSLAEIGIKVELKTLDPSAASDAKRGGDFGMAFSYCTTDIIDPDQIIRFAGLNSGGSYAIYSRYKNPKLEKLADKASQITDQAERTEIYHQIQQQVNADMPHIPLYYSKGMYSYSDTVHGFHPFPTGNYNLVDVWLSE